MSENTRPTIHLFIPQLLQPLIVWKKDFAFEPETPHLSQLLSQFESVKTCSSHGLVHAMFSNIGLSKNAELPAAFYRFQVHKNTQSNRALACADPVHLEVGLTDVVLTQTINDITNDEAHQLITILNDHFKQDDIEFVFGSNSQWYICTSTKLEPDDGLLQTQPLEVVLKQNIVNKLPETSDQNSHQKSKHNWQVIQNEAQMLLHSSDVNQQREMVGLPTVNSLWFWGAGKPIAKDEIKSETQQVLGGFVDEGIQGKTLAKALDCDWQALDENQLEPSSLSKNTMIILDQLISAESNQQPEQFQEALTQIDKDFIKPLMTLWKQGKIELIIDSCDGNLIKPVKSSVWKFWTKPTPLLGIAKNIAQKGQKVGGCA